MAITNGQTGSAGDFVATSSGAGDSGKVAKLDANGRIPVGFIDIVVGGNTLAVTTIAGQRILVWAKGNLPSSVDNFTVTMTLQYNGVTKDTVVMKETANTGSSAYPFALMYTETPGAATHNIVVVSDGAAPDNVVIMVLKF
jgi:hypothetical protein